MSDIEFAKGLKVKKINDTFFSVSVNLNDFWTWAESYKNNEGYINLNLCKAKDKDNWYFKLNTWKPDKQKEAVKVEEQEEEIPF